MNHKTNPVKRNQKKRNYTKIDCKTFDREERKAYRNALRLRKVKRQRTLFSLLGLCAVFLIVLSVSVLLRSVKTSANDGFKYYTSVAIEDGDTLWSLADNYIDYAHYKSKDSYISEVISINHLSGDCHIKAGQFLIIPYYSNEYVE